MPVQTQNIVAETKLSQGSKHVFRKFQSIPLFSRRRYYVFNIFCLGRKRGSICETLKELLTLKDSECFIVCVNTEHMLKMQNLYLGIKQNCCLLPVCSPMQHREQH